MITILNLTWGILQNLVGAVIFTFCGLIGFPYYKYKQAYCMNIPNFGGAVSLGLFIIGNLDNEETVKHEYGHTTQSALLGIFYLLVIGLPSILWASLGEKYRKKHGKSYYDFYTEKWADKLGKVER